MLTCHLCKHPLGIYELSGLLQYCYCLPAISTEFNLKAYTFVESSLKLEGRCKWKPKRTSLELCEAKVTEITSVSKQSVFIQSDSILQTRSFSQSDVTLQIKDDMNTSCSPCLFTNGFVRCCNYYELFLEMQQVRAETTTRKMKRI